MRFQASVLLPLSLLSALAFTGCATSFAPTAVTTTAPVTSTLGTIQGNVFGGRSPIVGARIYVLAAATTGYGITTTGTQGIASTSLLTAHTGVLQDTAGNSSSNPTFNDYYVTTDSTGSFTITGDYTCTAGTQIYLYSRGGVTYTGGADNPQAGLMALLGTCPAAGTLAGTISFIYMNEVSTVAAAYAIGGFGFDPGHIGSSGTTLAATGLSNAFSTALNLYDLFAATNTAGARATTVAGNGTVPQAEMNTLANFLVACINSANTSASSSGQCDNLRAYSTSNGTTGTPGTATAVTPLDTAAAIMNIVHYPAANVGDLCALQGSGPAAVYTPALTCTGAGVPNDFSVKVYYTGGGLEFSTQNAVDGSGNIWVSGLSNNTLNKFSPLGVPLSGTTGFTGGGLNYPSGVAIDTSGNAWVANRGGGNVSKFNSSGVTQAGNTGFMGNNDLQPYQIAIDTNGYVWVTNYTLATVSKISSTGTETLNTTGGGSFAFTAGIAIDATNQVWVSDLVQKFALILDNSTGNYNSSFSCDYSCRFLELTSGSSPSAWVSNSNGYISEGDSNTGAATDFSGGGLNRSISNILDGAGNIWVTNNDSSVSEFNSAGEAITPSTGYTSTLSQTYGIAVDGSGNVWVTDIGTSQQLMEIVGAATPTVTPLVQAVINNNIAGRP